MLYRLLANQLEASSKSVLLLGPRQVGKSTLVRSLRPDLEINLADRATFLAFAANPSELQQRLAARPAGRVFIDEVQKLPPLLDTLQVLLDAPGQAPPKFFLTGSSARKLRRGGANLLPGRVFVYALGALCSAELDYEMDTRRGLETGFLPEAYLAPEPLFRQKLLSSYASTYLAEEIQAEALTRNLEGFARFIHAAAMMSGQYLDFSKLAKQARISRQSCTRFYEILEDTLIARRAEPYWPAARADLVKHPKFYFFDVGVLNGLLGNFVASADRIGVLTEHMIFNQLVQSAQARDKKIEISTFRTRGGLEVDFIVTLDAKVWAIEVKAGLVGTGDVRALRELPTYLDGPHEKIVATLDGVERKVDGVWVLPWQQMLRVMGL